MLKRDRFFVAVPRTSFAESVYEVLKSRAELVFCSPDEAKNGPGILPADAAVNPGAKGIVRLFASLDHANGVPRAVTPQFSPTMIADLVSAAIVEHKESAHSAWVLDHVAVAVDNLDENIRVYRDIMGFEYGGDETVAEQGVRTAFMRTAHGDHVELLLPISDDSPVKKYLEKRGPGLHHICVTVPDVAAAIKNFADAGLKMINDHPVHGAGGKLVAFVHPKSAGGVMVELSQDA